MNCKNCAFYPCMSCNCDIHIGGCEKGMSTVYKEILEIYNLKKGDIVNDNRRD